MSHYQEIRFYDGVHLDGEAVRLSMAGRDGREYFQIIEGGHGREYRERRDQALQTIRGAIIEGRDPGRVDG